MAGEDLRTKEGEAAAVLNKEVKRLGRIEYQPQPTAAAKEAALLEAMAVKEARLAAAKEAEAAALLEAAAANEAAAEVLENEPPTAQEASQSVDDDFFAWLYNPQALADMAQDNATQAATLKSQGAGLG